MNNTVYGDNHIILSESCENQLNFIGAFASEEIAIREFLLYKEQKEGVPTNSVYTFKDMRTGDIQVVVPNLIDSRALEKSLQDLHAAPFMNETLTSVLEAIERKTGEFNASLI